MCAGSASHSICPRVQRSIDETLKALGFQQPDCSLAPSFKAAASGFLASEVMSISMRLKGHKEGIKRCVGLIDQFGSLVQQVI